MINPQLPIMLGAILVLGYLIWCYKQRIALPLLVAIAIAFGWTSYYRYEYIGENFYIFDQINIYPLLLWTLGLISLYVVDMHVPKNRTGFFISIVVCLILLGTIEAVGYYLLDIRLASNFTSFLGLGVLHAPAFMKIFYILAGPLYLLAFRSATPSR